ncbi:MAG: hypothetical protein Ct9H300mP28_20420 [Pseudomonadota bacterium]|nr:MAG: hypothetical protein Ct9H300mP28_20420 [Pseudomonadota bacterium]
MPELKNRVYPFFEAGLQCGQDLMRAFAIGMGIPEESFTKKINEPIARGSISITLRNLRIWGNSVRCCSAHGLRLPYSLWQDQVGGLDFLK